MYPAQVRPVAAQLVPPPPVVAPASQSPCAKQEGQIIVGGNNGMAATAMSTTESPEMLEAEREVETFEKFVVQAERQAGLPDTIHTSTTPYNVDLMSKEEREEMSGVMAVIFGVSIIGIGGVLYMVTQQSEQKKEWEVSSEQDELQQQLRQQQSW